MVWLLPQLKIQKRTLGINARSSVDHAAPSDRITHQYAARPTGAPALPTPSCTHVGYVYIADGCADSNLLTNQLHPGLHLPTYPTHTLPSAILHLLPLDCNMPHCISDGSGRRLHLYLHSTLMYMYSLLMFVSLATCAGSHPWHEDMSAVPPAAKRPTAGSHLQASLEVSPPAANIHCASQVSLFQILA
jgi:hypothetical protein